MTWNAAVLNKINHLQKSPIWASEVYNPEGFPGFSKAAFPSGCAFLRIVFPMDFNSMEALPCQAPGRRNVLSGGFSSMRGACAFQGSLLRGLAGEAGLGDFTHGGVNRRIPSAAWPQQTAAAWPTALTPYCRGTSSCRLKNQERKR